MGARNVPTECRITVWEVSYYWQDKSAPRLPSRLSRYIISRDASVGAVYSILWRAPGLSRKAVAAQPADGIKNADKLALGGGAEGGWGFVRGEAKRAPLTGRGTVQWEGKRTGAAE